MAARNGMVEQGNGNIVLDELISETYSRLKVKTNLEVSQEEVFAVQACMKNKFLQDVARKNPGSLRLALQNAAAVEITLNPVEKLAYLVPRGGEVVLDISYRGLIAIASLNGVIKAAKAEIIYEGDTFIYHGPFKRPEYLGDPLREGEREIRGVYCEALMNDGFPIIEVMKWSELMKIRDRSLSWSSKKTGPWKDWPEEMIKKTVIKRAAKTWPGRNPRLDQAISILNSNGEGLPEIENEPYPPRPQSISSSMSNEDIDRNIAKLVSRARSKGMWEAAIQYAEDRFQGESLEKAIRALSQARSEAESEKQ